MLLADDFTQASRAHPYGQRSADWPIFAILPAASRFGGSGMPLTKESLSRVRFHVFNNRKMLMLGRLLPAPKPPISLLSLLIFPA